MQIMDDTNLILITMLLPLTLTVWLLIDIRYILKNEKNKDEPNEY